MESKITVYTYQDILRTLKAMGRDMNYGTLRRYIHDYQILKKAPSLYDHPNARRYFELNNAIVIVLEILSKVRGFKYDKDLVIKAKNILEKK